MGLICTRSKCLIVLPFSQTHERRPIRSAVRNSVGKRRRYSANTITVLLLTSTTPPFTA